MQLRHEDDTRWIDTASGWFHPHGLKTDVEDETNGLFSYDRKLQKLLPEEFENVRRIVESINRS